MPEVKAGDTVAIHYTGRLDDGTTFESSRDREPLTFEVGAGQIIPGLDRALPGMAEGDTKTVAIAPEDAYGPVNPDARQAVPRADIPDHIPLDPGTQLQVQTAEGQTMPVIVADVTDDIVVLDANHPLAGETLNFDIELVRIDAA